MENNVKLNTVKTIGRSDYVMMGPIRLRQPIPTNEIDQIDPFLLLHHYGPFEISPESNPFDLGPHPHRGFVPVTFLFQGEQLHRDSLGNESVVKAGGVQWTIAGRGIVHTEGPYKKFVEKGGTLEGIQLWINLPASKKMMQPNYQHVAKQDFELVTSKDGLVNVNVITGSLNDKKGKIVTQTPMDIFSIEATKGGEMYISTKRGYNSTLYLLDGEIDVNYDIQLKKNESQLIQFLDDGDGFHIKTNENAKLLFLSGEPINEKVMSYGPYVMNTQTEILEAMRDYQQGKMGFLPA